MKKKKEIKNIYIILTFFIFLVGMIMVGLYIDYYNGGKGVFTDEYNKELKNNLKSILNEQSKTNKLINKIVASNEYTFEKPYVINNPYKINPLSSMIIFKTREAVSIDIYINDLYVTKTESETEHIIPIYGLYSNAKNNVKLVTSDGRQNTIEIKIEAYNNYLFGYDLASNLNGKKYAFIVGEMYTNNIVRGFDYNNNLIFYLELKNINGFDVRDNRIYVSYNPKITNNTNLNSLYLEMDYLGRIISIKNDNSITNMEPNLIINNNNYIMKNINIYPEVISKYIVEDVVNYDRTTEFEIVDGKVLNKDLLNAKYYDKNYNLVYMGDYITFDFEDITDDTKLLFVDDRNNIKEYKINGKNMIKISEIKDQTLYLYSNGEYYNLLSKIKN